jgi:thiol:disulfide interchange protein DsbG
LAIYMLSDGSAVVGTRVSADGKILDQEALSRLVAKPMADSAMKQLEAASWILDGSRNAPKVVYVFTDANCPYCHHFWQAARPRGGQWQGPVAPHHGWCDP